MVEFSRPQEEERVKEFEDLRKKKEETLKEIGEEKEKELEDLRRRELALEALRREKEQTEKKLKRLSEKEQAKSKELEEQEKRLREEAEALARRIEGEAEAVVRLRAAPAAPLEEVITAAAEELPMQPGQAPVQPVYQPPPMHGEASLYQRLAELRGGWVKLSHRISGSGDVFEEEKRQVGQWYQSLQDLVRGLADHASQGKLVDEADAARDVQLLNQLSQAVNRLEGSPLGELYGGRIKTLINVASGYLTQRQEELYKSGGQG